MGGFDAARMQHQVSGPNRRCALPGAMTAAMNSRANGYSGQGARPMRCERGNGLARTLGKRTKEAVV